jgi:hypothetical protein
MELVGSVIKEKIPKFNQKHTKLGLHISSFISGCDKYVYFGTKPFLISLILEVLGLNLV